MDFNGLSGELASTRSCRIVLLLFVAFLSSILISSVAYADIAVTITPSSIDTTTKNTDVNANFGHDTFIEPEGPSNNFNGYIMFDISSIPAGSVIVSAGLKLYDTEGNGGAQTVYVYRVDSSWSEYSLTWNTNPTVESSPSASLPFTNLANTGYYSWDVKADVQSFIDGSATNYGWCLTVAGGWVTFASREGASNVLPQLVVTYVPGSVVPEYYFGALIAISACFAAFFVVKRSKLWIRVK